MSSLGGLSQFLLAAQSYSRSGNMRSLKPEGIWLASSPISAPLREKPMKKSSIP
jgi:hypothetical protein